MRNRNDVEILLAAPDLRRTLMLQHPLIQQSEIFPTPPIKEFLVQVQDVTLSGETGAWAVASPGKGKTSSLLYVEATLHELVEGVMVIFWGMQDQQTVSIRAFHMRGLEAVYHNEFKGETPALRRRMVNKVIDDARISRCFVVVIAIDEAQEMTITDLRFLKSLYNDIQRAGLLVVCVLLGQSPNMQRLMTSLESKENSDLMGRFGMHELVLRGYNCFEDVEALLREIDHATFSDELPIYLPQFFVPDSWARGWRLEHEAPVIWAAIKGLMEVNGYTEIPARPLFGTIRRFFQGITDINGAKARWQADLWNECLARARMDKAFAVQDMSVPMMHKGAKGSIKCE